MIRISFTWESMRSTDGSTKNGSVPLPARQMRPGSSLSAQAPSGRRRSASTTIAASPE